MYVGCFVDNERDPKWEPVLTNRDDLTTEICIQKCYNETHRANAEMTFAALTVSVSGIVDICFHLALT